MIAPNDGELLEAVDAAVERCTDHAFAFLERLVAAPSTIGLEGRAQSIVAEELGRLGFDVRTLEIPDDIVEDPVAGVPQAPYDGRHDVVGTMTADGNGPSLLVNGHID
ncbi:MAG: hypothetical protein ACRDHI_11940, partial [Actinomycetota bacterium]